MAAEPILLIGGSGVIGKWTAEFLRKAHPDLPLLIGGRNLSKAQAVASEIAKAEGVAVDLSADDLGLGNRPVGAVAVFMKDDAIGGLRFAQARHVPHISISSGVQEMGPEVSAFMQNRDGAPVVHPRGQVPLTGLGVAMVLERLLGLDGDRPTPPGLYFPVQLLAPEAYFKRLDEIGGKVLTLE